jgi:cysteinyl-tRNA synthetase
LGDTFDIHGGGLDLIFPHHENEIAQSECCNGKPFVRYWMHNGFIERGGEKMAKSVGNIDRLRDLLDEFPGEAIRLMLLKTHYRSPLEFTKDGLGLAVADLNRLYRSLDAADAAVAVVEQSAGNLQQVHVDTVREAVARFDPDDEIVQALQDDLNTPLALGKLRSISDQIFHAGQSATDLVARASRLRSSAALLGLLGRDPAEALGIENQSGLTIDAHKIRQLIDLRLAARKAKNFKEADRIRDELAQQGVLLEDGPKGTTWRRAG